jgi:hypothetical protein
VGEVWRKHARSSDPIYILNENLNRFNRHFKEWGFILYGHIKRRKKTLREELACLEDEDELIVLSSDDFVRKTEIVVELHCIFFLLLRNFIGYKDHMKGGCYREITTLLIFIVY